MCFEFVNSIVVNDTKKITNLKIKKVNNNIIYFEEDNRIGLMDINGNILHPAEFEDISDFNSGIAKVTKNGYFGIINEYGKEITTPIYEYIDIYFDYNLYVCKLNNFFKLYTLSGKLIYKDDNVWYNNLYLLGEGFIQILNEDNEILTFNKDGKIIKEEKQKGTVIKNVLDGYFLETKKNTTKVYNKDGKVVFKTSSQILTIKNNIYVLKKNNRIKIIDINTIEEYEISRKISPYFSFKNGNFLVFNNKDKNKYIFITLDKKIFEVPYTPKKGYIRINNNRIILFENNEVKLLGSSGNIILSNFNYMDFLSDEYILVSKGKNLFEKHIGIYDINGKCIIEAIYENVDLLFDNLFLAKMNNIYTLFNMDGKVIYTASEIKVLNVIDNLVVLQIKDRKLLIDTSGNVIINLVDDDIWLLNNNRIIVDNCLVDLNQEYFNIKIDYKLVFKINQKKYFCSCNSLEKREILKDKIDENIKKTILDNSGYFLVEEDKKVYQKKK